jgi:phospholipase C
MTMPNRAFACAATSQGHLDDHTKIFTVPSIFGLMTAHGLDWKIYGYTKSPLARLDFLDTTRAPRSHFGLFHDFQADAAAGRLPAYAFVEPSWSSSGNSQHPNYDVARGEQLLLDTFHALRTSSAWANTLLIITYDEHGGCYDHVAPPSGATPPEDSVAEFDFDFTRFGLRVRPCWSAPASRPARCSESPPTVCRWITPASWPPSSTAGHLPPLTARDAAAHDLSAVVTLTTARTDESLQSITAPSASTQPMQLATQPAHLQQVQAELAARLITEGHTDGQPPPTLHTSADYDNYITRRIQTWETTRT